MSTPECWNDCSAVLKSVMASKGADVTVSSAAPLIMNPYTIEAFTCPHGVHYYMEPTSEQIARWAADGVR